MMYPIAPFGFRPTPSNRVAITFAGNLNKALVAQLLLFVGTLGLAPAGYMAFKSSANDARQIIKKTTEESIDISVDRAVDNSDDLLKELVVLVSKSAAEKLTADKSAPKTTVPDEATHKGIKEKLKQVQQGALLVDKLTHGNINDIADILVNATMHGASTEQTALKLKSKLKEILKTHIKSAMAEQKNAPGVIDNGFDTAKNEIQKKAIYNAIPVFICILMMLAGSTMTYTEFRKMRKELDRLQKLS